MRFALGAATALAAAAGVWWFVLGGPTGAPCGGRCGDGTRCDAGKCVPAVLLSAAPAASGEPADARKGRRRRSSRRGAGTSETPDRLGESAADWAGSDDLDLPPQQIDMEHGGEQQLSNATIESTMGRSFGAIRRCILIAQSDRDTPVHGRMNIGIRIRPSGEVGAVQVRPPAALAGSEIVPCVRGVVGRIRFPGFDGRDMVVTYPVTLE